MDKKRAREIIGYTHQKQSKDAASWFKLACSFHIAAAILNEREDDFPADTRPFAFNAALSLELIFKSILAYKELQIPTGKRGHDLRLLSSDAGIALSENQKLTLELLTQTIIWSGRYPTPNNSELWNEYQDRIFESHVVRGKIGNTYQVIANPDTFPDWKNYRQIWDLSVGQYGGSHSLSSS